MRLSIPPACPHTVRRWLQRWRNFVGPPDDRLPRRNHSRYAAKWTGSGVPANALIGTFRSVRIRIITTEIVLLDFVGFSKLKDEEQYLAILWLEHALEKELALFPLLRPGGKPQFLLGIIPTGDGVYLLLHPSLPGYGILCALALRALLLTQIARGEVPYSAVRLAVTLGTAIPYRDVTGRLNFVGGGLNACARIIQPAETEERKFVDEFSGDANSVLAGESAVASFRAAYLTESADTKEYFGAMKLRISDQRKTADKHGETHAYHVVEAARRLAILPSSPRHLTEDQIAELDEYLESLRTGLPTNVDSPPTIANEQDAAG